MSALVSKTNPNMLCKFALWVALLVVGCNCSGILCSFEDFNSIRGTLNAARDYGEIASEMLEFQDQLHHFSKTKRTHESVAAMSVANAQALIASLSHAIKGKSVEVCTGIMSRKEDAQDLNDVRLIIARALLRTKVTIQQQTDGLWQRTYELIKLYGNSDAIGDIAERVADKLNKDYLSIAPELALQTEAIERYSPSDDLTRRNLVEFADQILDDAFACSKCSGLANDQGISPLGTDEMVAAWLEEYVDRHFLSEVKKSEALVSRLVAGKEYETKSTAASLEEIEAELGSRRELDNKPFSI